MHGISQAVLSSRKKISEVPDITATVGVPRLPDSALYAGASQQFRESV
jgi:hypothetical protein